MHIMFTCARCGKMEEGSTPLPEFASFAQRVNAQALIRKNVHRIGWRKVKLAGRGYVVIQVCPECLRPEDEIHEGV